MSVSIEDKIELFRKMIFSDIENSSSEKKQKLSESFETEKHKFLQEAEQKKQEIIREAVTKAEKEKKQILSKAQAVQYHRLLSQNQEFVNQMIDLLKKEAADFVRSEGYKIYISDNLAKATKLMEHWPSVHYYFTKTDIEGFSDIIDRLIADLRGKGTYAVKEAEPGIIGGFFVEDEEQIMQLDYTLKSLVEENRELIGSSISRRIDEVKL